MWLQDTATMKGSDSRSQYNIILYQLTLFLS